MALRTPERPGRGDHTKQPVGDQGDEIAQEPGSGKQVHRRGAAEAEADIDVGTDSNPSDLADGDFESGAKNAGGAEALSGYINTQDGNTFSVEVDWLDDDENVVITDTPSPLTDVPDDVKFDLKMRSDRFEIRVTDTSGAAQNRVNGTFNAH